MSNPNAIRLDSVSKSFDGFKALSEASFTARWARYMLCWARTERASRP